MVSKKTLLSKIIILEEKLDDAIQDIALQESKRARMSVEIHNLKNKINRLEGNKKTRK